MRSIGLLLCGLVMVLPVWGQNTGQTGPLVMLLQQGANYQVDSPRDTLAKIEALMRQLPGSPAVAAEYEACFLKALQQGGSLAWKDFLCRQLSMVGSDASVDPMLTLLRDEKTSDMARYVLERLDSPRVNPALRAALQEVKGNIRIGVVNTLGVRGDTEAVAVLQPLLNDSSTDLSAAAITALGRIGSPAAIEALISPLATAEKPQQRQLYEALLVAAEGRAQQGDKTSALKAYRQVARSAEIPLQRAALIGQVEQDPQQAVTALIAALKIAPLQETVMILVAQQRDSRVVSQLAGQLNGLPADQQIQLLHALAVTGQASALPAVMPLLATAEDPVKVAALQAVGALGGADEVELVAHTAAGTRNEVQSAARTALSGLKGAKVDDKIVGLLGDMPPQIQIELALAAEQRRIGAAAPTLMTLAQGDDRRVRRAALEALAEVAGSDQLKPLFQCVIEQQSPPAQDALVKSALRLGQAEQVSAWLIETNRDKSDLKLQTQILKTLSQLGQANGLEVIRKATDSQDEGLRTEAIRALAQWPTPAPQALLLSIAQTPGKLTQRVLALRGFVDMAAMKAKDQPQQAVKDLTKAVTAAQRVEEKRYILGALSQCACVEALTLAQTLEQDTALETEAQMAQVKVCQSLPRNQRGMARTTLEGVLERTTSEAVRDAARGPLRGLQR